MRKTLQGYRVVLLTVGLLVFGHVESVPASRVYEEGETRRARFALLRPAKSTPEAQWAYSEKLREDGRPRGATRQYRALVRYWPHSPEAAKAQYRIARLWEERGRESRAFEEYERLIEKYAGQFPYQDVLQRQFDIAKSHLEERRGRIFRFRGVTSPERAIPKLERLLKNAPQWERAAEAQYLLGRAHEETRQYELAAHAYETVITRYPRSAFVEEATFGRAHVLYKIAREYRHYDQAAETALIALDMFLRAHPRSGRVDRALEMRDTLTEQRARLAWQKADYYDRIARRPESALMTYEMLLSNFPESPWTERAEKRMAKLKSKLEKSSAP